MELEKEVFINLTQGVNQVTTKLKPLMLHR